MKSPVAVMAPMVMLFRSFTEIFVPQAEIVPKSFVLLESVTSPEATRLAVPLTVRLPDGSVMLPPVISVRFARVMAVVMKISPVVLFPMVSRLAVILPISVDVRPKLPADFVPRSTMEPDVGISRTEPEDVASTVLLIVTFWAVI